MIRALDSDRNEVHPNDRAMTGCCALFPFVRTVPALPSADPFAGSLTSDLRARKVRQNWLWHSVIARAVVMFAAGIGADLSWVVFHRIWPSPAFVAWSVQGAKTGRAALARLFPSSGFEAELWRELL
jgi:hypothetical protein